MGEMVRGEQLRLLNGLWCIRPLEKQDKVMKIQLFKILNASETHSPGYSKPHVLLIEAFESEKGNSIVANLPFEAQQLAIGHLPQSQTTFNHTAHGS